MRYFILALVLALSACSTDNTTSKQEIATSPTVQQLVNKAYQSIDPLKINYYLNASRAEHYLTQSKAAQGIQQLDFIIKYAGESLKAGATEKAITQLEFVNQKLADNNVPINPEVNYQLQQMLGLAYLRLGEQQNCLESNNVDACLFPITKEAVFSQKRGPEFATKIFEQMLQTNPQDQETIWLLNLAHMTLGTYPEAVPRQFLIPETRLKSEVNFPKFENVGFKSKTDKNGLAGGVCAEDFDNDGYVDIMASSWGFADCVIFYKNMGDGTFENRSKSAGLETVFGGLNMIHGDYNNDGFSDVLVLRGAWFFGEGKIPNSLLKNNGDGTFTDVTIEAGVLSAAPTQAAAWGDLNNDGWLDLVIANESTGQASFPTEVYLNQKDGTFKNAAAQMGLNNQGFFKGLTIGDVNNDNHPDIYFSNLAGANQLMLSNGQSGANLKFTEVAQQAGVTAATMTFPCWFWDYNNDGWQDLFVANYGVEGEMAVSVYDYYKNDQASKYKPYIFINNQDGTFKDVAIESNVKAPAFAMGSNYGDLDNDGWEDFYLGTGSPSFKTVIPNLMYKNQQGKRFANVTTAGGFGHIQKGHGVAFVDFDNDGDQDIYEVMGGSYEGDVFKNILFKNPSTNGNKWLKIKLLGKGGTNKLALGARVQIKVVDKNGQTRTIHRTVSTGGSFGADNLTVEAGLGTAQSIESVAVLWPNGSQSYQTYKDIKLNTFIQIEEGEVTASTLNYSKFEL